MSEEDPFARTRAILAQAKDTLAEMRRLWVERVKSEIRSRYVSPLELDELNRAWHEEERPIIEHIVRLESYLPPRMIMRADGNFELMPQHKCGTST